MTEQFIQERTYFKGVSMRTVGWYRWSFKAFSGAMESKAAVMERIGVLKARGVSHIGINSYLRAVNAYFMWLHKEHGKELIRIPRLKEEQKILATLTPEMITRVIRGVDATKSGTNLRRAHLVALTILDTGLRASE